MSSTLNLRRCYLAFTWKRCFRRLGKLFCGLALLGIICASAIYGLSFVNQKNDTSAASHFNVVFVMPKNAGLHYSLALGMVSNMESLSSMVTIKQTTSEDEAKAMLDSGEVKAAVIIPEGMIHTIMSGTNDLPARIIYPGEPSIETVIFRQIVGSDIEESSLEKEEISSDNAPATDFVLVGYLCSGLALLFLLSGINLCFFFVAPNRTVLPALSRLGLSDSFCLLADFSAAVICQWLIFSAICLLIGTIGSAAHIVPAFLIGHTLVSCFVCAFFSCALELFICRICHGKQACMITTFAVSLLVMYASGCLIPSAFLPDMLRRISATLPGSQLKNMIFWQFGQSVSSFDIIILIIEGILLIIAALLAGTFKKGKLTHSLRERSKYEEK